MGHQNWKVTPSQAKATALKCAELNGRPEVGVWRSLGRQASAQSVVPASAVRKSCPWGSSTPSRFLNFLEANTHSNRMIANLCLQPCINYKWFLSLCCNRHSPSLPPPPSLSLLLSLPQPLSVVTTPSELIFEVCSTPSSFQPLSSSCTYLSSAGVTGGYHHTQFYVVGIKLRHSCIQVRILPAELHLQPIQAYCEGGPKMDFFFPLWCWGVLWDKDRKTSTSLLFL